MSLIEPFKKLWLEGEIELIDFGSVEVPFSEDWKRVCIDLSGGADSALLMASLCKIIEDNGFKAKVDAISLIRCWSNRPWQPFIAERVFNKIKSMFPSVVENQHKAFLAPELEHAAVGNIVGNQNASMLTTRSFNDFHCFYDEDVGAVFHGRTKNPAELKSHPSRMETRDEPRHEDAVEELKHSSVKVYRPFLFMEKDWIVSQFYEQGWDSLFETTRSCEGNIPELKKGWRFKADEPIPECGKCFWCAERKWALEKINKE